MNGKRWMAWASLLILLVGLLPTTAAGQIQPATRSLGCLFTPPDQDLVRVPPVQNRSALLDAVDLSADLPPVGSQGAQASCVGWATAYYCKSYQEKREHGYMTVLSPAYVFNQIYIEYLGGVAAYIGDALDLLVSQGSAPWSQFPYTDSDYKTQPMYEQRRSALPYQALTYGAFFLSNIGDPRNPTPANNNLQPLKAWLAGGNPVILALPVYAEFDAPAGPHAIVDVPANAYSFRGGHAILLVGYDDNIGGTGVGGFKFVNSWSTAYGNAGYGYLTYDFVRQYVMEAWWLTDRMAQGPYSVCGHVERAGLPLPGTYLTANDTLTVCTSSDGFYGWGGLAVGDMVVRPTKPDHTFNPAARWVPVAGHVEHVDFSGVSVNTNTLDCSVAIDARMGGTFSGNTIGAATNVHRYNCVDWNESGPEHVYRVVSNRTGPIWAMLSHLSADLDVFILAACDETTCLAAGQWMAGRKYAVYDDAPMGTYYVVVDGYNGVDGSYELTIEVPWDWAHTVYLPLVARNW